MEHKTGPWAHSRQRIEPMDADRSVTRGIVIAAVVVLAAMMALVAWGMGA